MTPKNRSDCSIQRTALLHTESVYVTDLDPSGAGIVLQPTPAAREGTCLEVLVPGALPGEEIALTWRPPQPGGRRGLAERFTVLKASPDLDPSRCPHAGICGGCPAGRLQYTRELAIKTARLVKAPLVEAGFSADLIRPTIGQPDGARLGFRNKAILYPGIIEGTPHFGYYKPRSQTLVAAEDCPQTPQWMGDVARALAPLLLHSDLAPWHEDNTSEKEGALRTLLLREAPGTGERLVAIVMKRLPAEDAAREVLFSHIRDALKHLRIDALLVNLHDATGSSVLSFAPGATRILAGKANIKARLMELTFTLGAETFLQVNTPQTPVLYGLAIDALKLLPEDRVLDLYCGVGTLTLLAARHAERALGIERVTASIQCAQENAQRNHLENAFFLTAPVEKALKDVATLPDGFVPTKIIVDPAYQGLAGGAAEALVALVKEAAIKRLVYVSCNPVTLARDAATLMRGGLELLSVTPVDMFPGAMHLEAVAVFVPADSVSATC